MNLTDIENQLSSVIDPKISSRLVKYYSEAKDAYFKGDSEKAQLKSGKFVEQVCRALKYKETGNVITGKIEVDRIVISLENASTSLGDGIRIIIPRVIRAVYSFRNKRSVAHSHDIDPSFIDAEFCLASLDWIMAELLRLFHNFSEEQIRSIMRGLFTKKVPVMQKIGDAFLILDKKMSARNSILLILYSSYPDWVEISQLTENLVRFHTKNNISKSLSSAVSDRLVFSKDDKCVITDAGLDYVETNLKEKLILGPKA